MILSFFKKFFKRTGKGMIHLIIRYGTTLEKPETILSGQLSKQSPITVWQNRYFELKKDGLFWYQSPVVYLFFF